MGLLMWKTPYLALHIIQGRLQWKRMEKMVAFYTCCELWNINHIIFEYMQIKRHVDAGCGVMWVICDEIEKLGQFVAWF
jgi:hypothetical protein